MSTAWQFALYTVAAGLLYMVVLMGGAGWIWGVDTLYGPIGLVMAGTAVLVGLVHTALLWLAHHSHGTGHDAEI